MPQQLQAQQSHKTERRVVTLANSPVKLEKRTAADGKDKQVFSGYGAVFYDAGDEGTEYTLFPGMRERIMPGCFDRCVRERQDVRGLYNHVPDNLLGRTSSGTMRLSIDARGLKYEIDYDPSDMDHQRVKAKMDRGDLTGSSFSFRIVKQVFTYNDGPGGDDDTEEDIRELLDVDVYDVGPVSFPAYESTTTGIRAIGDLAEVRCACEDGRAHQRGAVTYAHGAVIRSDSWDEDSARARVLGWASAGDQMDHGKLKRAFAFSDGSATEAGHKLLHHDVRDGKLCVHSGGVERCLRMMDEDGEGDIPEADRAAVRSHLERHRDAINDEDGDEDDSDTDPDDEKERKRRSEADRMRLRLAEAM